MKELIFLALILVFGLTACSVKTTHLSQPSSPPETLKAENQPAASNPQASFGIDISPKPIADITTQGVSIPVYHAATLPLTTVKNAPSHVRQELDALGALLQKNPAFKATIDGHTWSFGNPKSNKEISQDAAASVKKHLVDVWRIQEERILAVGCGADSPIATNDTPEGRQTNRRLQIVVTGPPQKNLATAPLSPVVGPQEAQIDEPARYECVVQFDSGAAILHAEFQKKVHEAGRALQDDPKAAVIVEGHTDNKGDPETNAQLSLERARVVKNILRQVYSIPDARILVLGYGEEKPLADNATPDGREKNRRVAIQVTTSSARIQTAQELLAAPRKKAEAELAAAALPAALPVAPGKAAVICYHRFDESRPFSISSEQFEKQIKFMLDNGFNIVSSATLVEYMKQKNIPDKTVVITIDDGWRSSMRAFRVLKKYDLPFTLFLAMQYVGSVESSCLSMDDVKELKSYPKVTFGNHSYTHSPRLTHGKNMNEKAYEEYVRADIKKSVVRFREVIGENAKFFAYPFGYTTDAYVKALREAGLEYLFTVNPKLVENGADFVYLPRFGGHNLRIETLEAMFQPAPSKIDVKLANATSTRKHKLTPAREQSNIESEANQKKQELVAQRTTEFAPTQKKIESWPQAAITPIDSPSSDAVLPKALQPHSQLIAPLGLSLAGRTATQNQSATVSSASWAMRESAAVVANAGPNAGYVSSPRNSQTSGRASRLPLRYAPQRVWALDLASSAAQTPAAPKAAANKAPATSEFPKAVAMADIPKAVANKAPATSELPKAVAMADIPKADVTYAPIAPKNTSPTPNQNAQLAQLQAKSREASALSSRGPLEDLISITAVGDIMMGTTFPRNLLPPDDGAHSFDKVKEAFGHSDIQFGNLEGPLTDTGSPSKCGASGNCYEFKMPQRYVTHLKNAGFNVLNVANNHANDFGPVGALNTINTLQENNIAPIGGDFVAILNIRGKKVAMLGFAHNRKKNSHAITDIPTATQLVKKLKATNDLVIVSFHGGAEGTAAVNISDKTEVFCGENRGNVIQFAHAVVDAGADMVLGHGPHVLRAMEVYKGKLIAYSLGNFLVYETFGTNGPCGQSAILKAQIDAKTGNFVAGDIVPVKISQVGVPAVDKNAEAIKQIKMLTRNNLPHAAIAISDAGKIAGPQELVSKGSAALLR